MCGRSKATHQNSAHDERVDEHSGNGDEAKLVEVPGGEDGGWDGGYHIGGDGGYHRGGNPTIL